jgi:hypothetical protein
MNTNEKFLLDLIENTCPATVEYDSLGREVHVMWIETHCVGWWVRAYKDGCDTRWHIVSAESEAC